LRVLVFGRSGQVATELARQADVTALGRDAADLTDPEACAAAIRTHAPEAVINAAAYIAVDRAEEEEALATIVNGEALGAYGRSKLAGEEGVRGAGGTHAILRTSWVVSAHGSNFVKTMLRVSPERWYLRVVDDQMGRPTPAASCLKIAEDLADDPSKSGTYHFASAPDTSWAGFARAILEAAGIDVSVEPIFSSDYPTPARRPLNSRLDCSATEAAFGIARPDWREGLRAILTDLRRRGDLA
jgi:dTDP-4-dehydrorhamnose reductase